MNNEIFKRVTAAESVFLHLPYIFEINGQPYSKQDLQNWQLKEYKKTAKLLAKLFASKLTITSDMSFVEIKAAVIAEKIRLGQDTLKDALHRQTRLANAGSKFGVRASFGKRKVSVADIYIDHSAVHAKEAMATFSKMMTINSPENQFYNFKANPNHFYSSGSDTDQTVVEMTGGTRIANKFTLLYGDEEGLVTKYDPNFKYQTAGSGQLDDGFVIGGVRHQMTDEGDRLHAKLQAEFPAILPNAIIHAHAVHLLVEFSNWLTDINMMHDEAHSSN